MIRIITGVPGAGKTYYAIWEIVNRFFKFDKNYFLYLPKDNAKDLYIFSNVEDLKLPRVISFEAFLNKHSLSVEKFFTVETQESLLNKYKKVVYLLDEAQKYFHKKFFNKDVFFLFQYHRHLGIDFYLITQDITLIAPAITSLIEYEIRAVRRTNRLRNVFRYFYYANNEKIGSKTIPADPKIFMIYTSFKAQEVVTSSPRPVLKYSLFVILFIVLAVFMFKIFLSNFLKSSFEPVSIQHSSLQQHSTHVIQSKKTQSKKTDKKLSSHSVQPVVQHKRVSAFNTKSSISPTAVLSFNKSSFFKKYVWIPANSFNSTIVYSDGKPIKVMVLGKIYDPHEVPYPLAKVNNRYFFLVPSSDIPNQIYDSVSRLNASSSLPQSLDSLSSSSQSDKLDSSSTTIKQFSVADRCKGLSPQECQYIIDGYISRIPRNYLR